MLYIVDPVPECEIRQLNLTHRWREVLQLMSKGMSGMEIGKELRISHSAVRRHKERMLIANKCKTMNELIAKYYSIAGIV